VLVAIAYTFPWDNHLIATHIWSYHSASLIGILLGWVPIEEVVFFGLQPLLIGMWLFWLLRRLPVGQATKHTKGLRCIAASIVGVLWVIGLGLLLVQGGHITYLGWEITWALPPISLQLGLAADILWQHRWLIAWAMIPPIVYLSATDALAIRLGIWTINPQKSLDIVLGGQLPLEEVTFFLLTTTLISFGLVLIFATATQQRLRI